MKKVMIGCPVRNRAWILYDYLECLEELDYPADKLKYCFIINDCIDETQDILDEFAQKHPASVRLIIDNSPEYEGYIRGEYNFRRLAYLRNLLLKEFLSSDCDYLFSVDSDILVTPNILNDLINNNCEIVSGLVCNGHHIEDTSIYNVLLKNETGRYVHMKNIPRDGIFRVDCTGAAYLILRGVIEHYGIRYSDFYGAEDIGFCEDAARKGLKIYCDGRLECKHIMKKSVNKRKNL